VKAALVGEKMRRSQSTRNEPKMARMDDDPPKTISVPEAGRQYFDLAKNASYAAAARGEIPVIKIGSKLRVPVVALERMLVEAKTKDAQ
jgi:hypothetical protein